MDRCPLCGSPAAVTDVLIESYDVVCPECKKFRITARALAAISQNAQGVKDRLPLVSRASRHAQVPLLITDADDIVSIAEKEQTVEAS